VANEKPSSTVLLSYWLNRGMLFVFSQSEKRAGEKPVIIVLALTNVQCLSSCVWRRAFISPFADDKFGCLMCGDYVVN
jgi:hypothetical protein